MRIDLHAHSRASDGTEDPGVLVASAARAGLDVVALTDHDTTAGWADALAAAERFPSLTVVRGAEISCRREGVGLHLLAYRFDAASPKLAEGLEWVRNDRIPRAQAMVDLMARAGLPITWEDVLARTSRDSVIGRPHIADALIAAGVVTSREEAFAKYLHRSGPYYVQHRALDPVEAVGLVAAAGGVSVLAHPGAVRRGVIVSDAVIAEMAAAGLAGLEVDHPDHEPADRLRLRGLAGEIGLLVTGSSDYHGDGKPNRLGQETTSPEVYEALLGGTAAGSTAPAPHARSRPAPKRSAPAARPRESGPRPG